MKIKNLLFLMLALVVSCAKEPVETAMLNAPRILTAAPPENSSTKTVLDGATPAWVAGDCIWFSNGQKSMTVTLREEDIREDGKFEISIDGMPGKLYTIYPAACAEGVSDGRVTINFPKAADGSFASANIAAASVEEGCNSILFKNIGTVFKIRMDSDFAAVAEKVEISCPGIAGRYITSADDITVLAPAESGTEDKLELSTAGREVCYVGVPPVTMPSGTEFLFMDKQKDVIFTRVTTAENELSRNVILNISFLKKPVRLVQQSLLDPAWHEGDEITLTDGTDSEKVTIGSGDIAADGSVTVMTRLLIKDNVLRAVCPSSRYIGINVNGNVLINIPSTQSGSIDDADITYAVSKSGVLTFGTAAPVIRMTGLPGAAKSLSFNADYISGGQVISDTKMTSIRETGHAKLNMELTRRGSSVYYLAVSPSAAEGSIRYSDGDGRDIGGNSIIFKTSSSSIWEYGPVRDIAEIDLGDGCCNWIGYYPDDAMIPDLIMSGTHDAGTYGYDGLLSGQVKCQDINFSEQLKRGVRSFDLRLSENMNIFHGSFYCNVGLGTFLDACTAFLRTYPREVVFCFAKDENCEGEGAVWNQHFQESIDAYGRSNFVIDKDLPSYTLDRLRGKIVIITRNRSAGSFGYLEGAPRIDWPDDTWTTYTSGGELHIALEDNYTADKGDPKKNKILDFLNAIKNDGGYMVDGHRTRWVVTYTSGYNGYTFGIPWPEDFCDDLMKAGIVSSLQNNYDGLICGGITFFHDFIEKWDSYRDHLFNSFVRKK